MNESIFYTEAQYQTLPAEIAAEPGALDRAKDTLAKLQELLTEKQRAADLAKERYRTLVDGAAETSARAQAEEAEYERECLERYAEIVNLGSAADVDHHTLALSTRQQRIKTLRSVAALAHASEIPKRLLESLEAASAVAAAKSSIASQTALIAVTERYIVAEPLMRSQGFVSFPAGVGPAGQAIELAMRARLELAGLMREVTELRSQQKLAGLGQWYRQGAQAA